jgi:dolichol-phosphate mannosyltransferase
LKRRISVVIPTIEEEAVFELIERIRELLGKDTEIIIVDKSSREYYERLKKTGAIVIRQHSRGVEKAVLLGLRQASGNIVASIDADGTHDPRGIAEGAKIIERGEADLVLGNRLAGLTKGSMQRYQIFGNRFLSKLFNAVYKTNINDFLVGLFVMNRRALNAIKDIDPYRAGHAFFSIELAKRGFKIVDIPIKYYPRRYGESKLTRSKLLYGVNVASHIIRLARDYNPLLIFGGFGLILIVAGLMLGGIVIANFLATGAFTWIGRALMAFMLVVVGILSIIAGFIIDLLLEIEKKLSRH